MTQNPPVLFVDDDENLLMALKRKLRGKFNFDTAVGPLQALEKSRPVTDMPSVWQICACPTWMACSYWERSQSSALTPSI